jgi:protein-S-isoprenylcysteine O-methyltransferase Ste14
MSDFVQIAVDTAKNNPMRFLLVALGTFYFVSMNIISAKFFQVSNRAALKSKTLIAFFAGGGSIYAIWLLGTAKLPSTFLNFPAILLFAYAQFVLIWAWHSNRQRPLQFAFSSSSPKHFNQLGPYRFVRHPFYSSYCATWLSSIFATGDIMICLLAIGLMLMYWIAAKQEESAFLASEFSSDYQSYINKTNRFVPKFMRLFYPSKD